MLDSSRIRRDAHLWSAKLDDGDLSSEDRAALDAWLAADPRHTTALAKADLLWKRMGEIDYPPALAQSALNETAAPASTVDVRPTLWQRVSDTFGTSLSRFAAASTAVAAVIAIFVFVPGFPVGTIFGPDDGGEPVVFATQRSAMKYIDLPDGSRITLDAASRLSLPKGENAREVQLLAGNAAFDVAPDPTRPFTVEAGAADIRVTGTRFDVRLDEDATFIGVAEGSVMVGAARNQHPSTDGPRALDVQAGEAVTVTDDGEIGAIAEIFPSEFAAWRTGMMIYSEATLAEIIADANRYAADPIAVDPSIQNLQLSGSFNIKNTHRLLESLAAGLPVRVRDTDGQRTIVPAN